MTIVPLSHQRSADLARHLRQWRLDRDPADVPGPHRRRRPRRHLTQADMADLVGVSERWYRTLESGKPVRVSADLLARIADVLGLDESQRSTLYLLATAQPAPARNLAGRPTITPAMTRMIRAQPWPAYAHGPAWDILACNDSAATLFAWMRGGGNLATWVLTAPEARMQLLDWHTTWARPLIAQLRLASGCQPDNTYLNQIIADILDDNPTVQRLWDQTPATHIPADTARQLLTADGEPITVQVTTYVPYADQSVHMTVLVPALADEDRRWPTLRRPEDRQDQGQTAVGVPDRPCPGE